jgi:hypothetical protein
MANHFSQLLENFLKKLRKNAKPGTSRESCNDFTIRLNKQRKVFNYSIEIFIKNFSHYFTLFFASKFSSGVGKSWESGKETTRENKHYFIRIENLTTQIQCHNFCWKSSVIFTLNLLSVAQSLLKSETIKAHKIIYQAH